MAEAQQMRGYMTAGQVELRLAAIRAADAAGYSRGADEIGSVKALKAHRKGDY